jgi:predicted RND superfamily exporter protein
MSRHLAQFIRRRAGTIVIACLLLTGLSVTLASRLSISTDLSALLPRGYPSVEDLHRLLKRIGGSASLTVAIESPDFAANKRFADDLVLALRRDLPQEIVNIDYKVDALRRFYEEHAAVYLGKDDLLAVERDLNEAEKAAKIKASPVPYDLGLDDPPPKDAKDKPKDPLASIDERMHTAEKKFERYPDGYFAGEQGHLLAIFIRPRSSGADPNVARAFIGRVQSMVDQIGPQKYHPALKVSYTGAYQISLDEEAAIVHDLLSTAALCVGLIALAVTIYFRRIRVVALLGTTLVCGCAWAFGLAWLTVGYLNIQTAFLGSIIAGTGINYGVILVARYLEERGRGADEGTALETAISSTFVATLTASATTAISFGTLLIAKISSFRHFAIIGGGGILFCWVLSFTLLPALLVISDRLWPAVKKGHRSPAWPGFLSSLPVLYPRTIVVASLLCGAVSTFFFVRFLPNSLETDGRNLRNRSSIESGAAKLDHRVATLRGESTTPGFVVTESLDEARRVCEVLNARVAQEGPKAPVSGCKSVFSLLPEAQEEKLIIARRIVHHLDSLPSDAFDQPSRTKIDELRRRIVLEPVRLESLPEELVRPFREVSGEVGRLVAVLPPGGRDLWIAENLYNFTDAIRHIDLGDGRVVTSSGDAVIFADILRMITRDAPRTTALALGGVIFFVFLALRGGRGTLHIVAALVIGVLWMVGIASFMKVKVNFFNFVAVPTTFGIAVDYAINIWARYVYEKGDRSKRMLEALRSTGGAVFLCSLTTIIGYATIIVANNMALVSFGKLAILGEVTCIIASLFLMPATALLDQKT